MIIEYFIGKVDLINKIEKKYIFSFLCFTIWISIFYAIPQIFPSGSKEYNCGYAILFGITAIVAVFQIRRKMKDYM